MTDRFEAKANQIYRLPQENETGLVSMGFHVLTVSEFLTRPNEIAKEIAKILNNHWKD